MGGVKQGLALPRQLLCFSSCLQELSYNSELVNNHW